MAPGTSVCGAAGIGRPLVVLVLRFLVRIGENPAVATRLLAAIRAMRSCEFWPDGLSYVDVDLRHVHGHRQVTDAYLVSWAGRRGAKLASMDEGLCQEQPELTRLVPRA